MVTARKHKVKERRRYQRVGARFIVLYGAKPSVGVYLKTPNKEIDAIMQDIGPEGMAILTNYKLSVGRVFSTRFILVNAKARTLQGRVREIKVKSKVRYSLSTKEGGYRVGVNFLEVREANKDFIEKFIRAGRRYLGKSTKKSAFLQRALLEALLKKPQ